MRPTILLLILIAVLVPLCIFGFGPLLHAVEVGLTPIATPLVAQAQYAPPVQYVQPQVQSPQSDAVMSFLKLLLGSQVIIQVLRLLADVYTAYTKTTDSVLDDLVAAKVKEILDGLGASVVHSAARSIK